MKKQKQQWLAIILCLAMVFTMLPIGTVSAAEDKPYGYVMAYTNSKEAACLGNSLHLAYSKDGSNYTALNSNTGICFAKNVGGNKNVNPNGLLTPYIFRKGDGTYGMIARNSSNQSYLYVYDSKDLINFTNERKLTVKANVDAILECKWMQEDIYVIYWSDGTRTYQTTTKNFETANETIEQLDYKPNEKVSASTLPEGAVPSNVMQVTKEEYERLENKLGSVRNTGIGSVSVMADSRSNRNELLPKTVSASYSDGSKADFKVAWNADDLNRVNLSKKGTYEVKGTVGLTEYSNPFIEKRADPCITKGVDGYYYFTASYPMCGGNDKDGYDKIILRRSQTIEGLANAEEVTIWDCDDSSKEYRYIWAPEIHCIKGVFYIFYTSSVSSSSVWGIRPHVLMCTNPDKIMEPSSWEAKGQMLANVSDPQAFTNFSLDMTYFENGGHHYVMWAQTDEFSSIFLAEINPNHPWQCIRDCQKISIPEYSWERINENVNEGPSVLIRNGKIYCTYSASGTGVEYCIGLLSADVNADLFDPSSWVKQSYPILTSSDVTGEYGPGHNSFTMDEDGNDIFVYHARGEQCYNKQCEWANVGSLYDPCRDARIKRVHWAADGSPILKMTYAQELKEEYRTVTATITVAEDELKQGTLTYKAATGGSVNGALVQKITEGKMGSQVTAVPANGYRFVKWSDGNKSASRIDRGTGTDRTITAQFEKTEVQSKKVALSQKKVTLGVGETLKLKASITPSNTTNKKLKWSSSNRNVKVDGSGKITAKKKGTSVITVSTANGKKATCMVTVKSAPTKVTTVRSKTLKRGKSYQLKVSLSRNSASNKITYSSSRKSVVTVSSTGKIKALRKGYAHITVKTYNGKKTTVRITVR